MRISPQHTAELRDCLSEVLRLLRRYGCVGQAQVVEDLLALLDKDTRGFIDSLCGLDVWGGSGAVWETELRSPHIADSDAKQDDARFQREVIRLRDIAARNGLATDRMNQVASILRRLQLM